MDFHSLSLPPSSWSRTDADALLVVMAADADPGLLDKPLAALWQELCATGEVELKGGKSVLVHQPAKVLAPRVAFCVAANGSAKAMAKAFTAGLGLLKAGGSKTLNVGVLVTGGPTPAHAEALAVAALDAVYLYRHTKPSAPAAPALARFSPITQRSASSRFDLPQPLGPTTPVSPSWITKSVGSTKLLKPLRRSLVNRKRIPWG